MLDARPREEVSDPDFDGRAYALAAGSRKLLAALGLWGGLAAKAQPIAEIKISDGRPGEGAGPFFLHFHGQEIDEGPMGHILEDRWLRAALLAAMDAAPLVDYRPAARGDRPGGDAGRRSRWRSRAASGSPRRLLVACDGRDSAVARRAGIARRGWDYGQSLAGGRRRARAAARRDRAPVLHAVGAARDPAARRGTAPRSSGPRRAGGRRRSRRWTRRAISRRSGRGSATSSARSRLEGVRFSYPLGLSLAERLTAARVALAGDAAHGIHPLAGQGLNLGLRDVATLAEVLTAAARRGEDLGRAGRPRRATRAGGGFDVAALAAATDGINRLFSNDNPVLRLGRGLGLGLVGRLPALRRALIGEAAGLAGDLPQLLRGRLP